ncbi:uncharacterized protein PV07_12670, partial [Cladophialophora immunda]
TTTPHAQSPIVSPLRSSSVSLNGSRLSAHCFIYWFAYKYISLTKMLASGAPPAPFKPPGIPPLPPDRPDPQSNTHKTSSGCGQLKPKEDFKPKRGNKETAQCIDCRERVGSHMSGRRLLYRCHDPVQSVHSDQHHQHRHDRLALHSQLLQVLLGLPLQVVGLVSLSSSAVVVYTPQTLLPRQRLGNSREHFQGSIAAVVVVARKTSQTPELSRLLGPQAGPHSPVDQRFPITSS